MDPVGAVRPSSRGIGPRAARRTSAAALACAAAVVAAGCGGGSSADTPPVTLAGDVPADARAGLGLFFERGCTSCHALGGAGASAPGGDLSREGLRERGLEWQIAFLKDPRSKDPQSAMPAIVGLTEEQYRQLAVLLDGLGDEFTAAPG